MAISFQHPRTHFVDGAGTPLPGAKLYFYDPGTTTARTVYQDAALTQPHAQPVIADAAGRWSTIYLPTGSYKVRCETATNVLVYEQDDCDPGVPTGPGALPISSGGTGAVNAVAARSNLAAASSSDLASLQGEFNTLKAIVDPSIADSNDRLGTLAGLDTLRVQDVGTEFGVIEVSDGFFGILTVTSGTGLWQYDNTIPLVGEGNPAWSGSFTPKRADTVIQIEFCAQVASTGGWTAAAMFDGGGDLIAFAQGGGHTNIGASAYTKVEIPSWGAGTAKSFSLRYGAYAGTSYLNSGPTGGAMGGAYRSFVHFREIKRQ